MGEKIDNTMCILYVFFARYILFFTTIANPAFHNYFFLTQNLLIQSVPEFIKYLLFKLKEVKTLCF